MDITAIPLFNTPIFETKLNLDTSHLTEVARNVKYERMGVDNGWYSEDKYILDTPEFSELKNEIMKRMNFIMYEFLHTKKSYEFYMTNSWTVKHDKEDWGQTHVHTNCIFSGVYYIKTDENSGRIIFRKSPDRMTLFPLSCDLEFDDFNIFNSKVWTYQPSNNLLLLFPSYLQHSIEESSSDERYSVAFNFFVRGNIGTKEFELELK